MAVLMSSATGECRSHLKRPSVDPVRGTDVWRLSLLERFPMTQQRPQRIWSNSVSAWGFPCRTSKTMLDHASKSRT